MYVYQPHLNSLQTKINAVFVLIENNHSWRYVNQFQSYTKNKYV